MVLIWNLEEHHILSADKRNYYRYIPHIVPCQKDNFKPLQRNVADTQIFQFSE